MLLVSFLKKFENNSIGPVNILKNNFSVPIIDEIRNVFTSEILAKIYEENFLRIYDNPMLDIYSDMEVNLVNSLTIYFNEINPNMDNIKTPTKEIINARYTIFKKEVEKLDVSLNTVIHDFKVNMEPKVNPPIFDDQLTTCIEYLGENNFSKILTDKLRKDYEKKLQKMIVVATRLRNAAVEYIQKYEDDNFITMHYTEMTDTNNYENDKLRGIKIDEMVNKIAERKNKRITEATERLVAATLKIDNNTRDDAYFNATFNNEDDLKESIKSRLKGNYKLFVESLKPIDAQIEDVYDNFKTSKLQTSDEVNALDNVLENCITFLSNKFSKNLTDALNSKYKEKIQYLRRQINEQNKISSQKGTNDTETIKSLNVAKEEAVVAQKAKAKADEEAQKKADEEAEKKAFEEATKYEDNFAEIYLMGDDSQKNDPYEYINNKLSDEDSFNGNPLKEEIQTNISARYFLFNQIVNETLGTIVTKISTEKNLNKQNDAFKQLLIDIGRDSIDTTKKLYEEKFSPYLINALKEKYITLISNQIQKNEESSTYEMNRGGQSRKPKKHRRTIKLKHKRQSTTHMRSSSKSRTKKRRI